LTHAPLRPDVVPERSDTLLVGSLEYDARGQAFKTVDPAGRQTRQFFDDAGRNVKTVRNYVDGLVDASHADEDVTVETRFTADGQLATLTARNPATGDQVTRYVYGTTLNDSAVARADLLRAEIYPDSDDTTDPLGDGPDGVYDRVQYTYNRQGQRLTKTDQNGTVHAATSSVSPESRPLHGVRSGVSCQCPWPLRRRPVDRNSERLRRIRPHACGPEIAPYTDVAENFAAKWRRLTRLPAPARQRCSWAA
jgi:YD repeat-containing protein